jgi:hypothetical protein
MSATRLDAMAQGRKLHVVRLFRLGYFNAVVTEGHGSTEALAIADG